MHAAVYQCAGMAAPRKGEAVPPPPQGREELAISEGYARYALAVLVVVYVFNFLDRQILSILAERIKADLHLSDAQIGHVHRGRARAVPDSHAWPLVTCVRQCSWSSGSTPPH